MQMSEKPLKIIVEFRKKMQSRSCIVFLGGYPYKSRLGDGYFQRVASISQNLSGFLQIFIDRENIPHSSGWLDRPQPSVLSISIRHNWLARITAIIAVILSKRLYIHSIYPLKNLLFLFILPWVLKFIDFHGVVPEELHLMNDFSAAKTMGKIEEFTIRKTDYFVFVSEAMRNHFSNKYNISFDRNYLILPIIPKLSASISHKSTLPDRPIVVYAGGLQPWQKIPEIIDTIAKTSCDYQYKFYTSHTEELKTLLFKKGVQQINIEIAFKPHDELLNIYKSCHFGFLLRDDHVINRVSCPTKLIEYLAFGILPILLNDHIGDFYKMGIKYIPLYDFRSKNLPDDNCMKAMIEHNFIIYQSLLQLQQKEIETLKEIFLNY
jgi:glycosyltransferase involved in cell wall biosynthesis